MTQWCAFTALIGITVPLAFAGTQFETKAEQRKGMPEGCMTNAQVNAENVSRTLKGQIIFDSGGEFDCSDCEQDPIPMIQTWCQSNLPFKCWDGLFPKWEYERTRLRHLMQCDGFTAIRCEPWSPILGAACCSSPQYEPACNQIQIGPRPVFLPECQPVQP